VDDVEGLKFFKKDGVVRKQTLKKEEDGVKESRTKDKSQKSKDKNSKRLENF